MWSKFFKKYLLIISIIVLSLLPILSLFHSGFPVTHDGQDHVARIANFYQNLTEGNLIPRWAANLNWGYGHPILEFLYPLPSYVASFFHFVGFSLVDSTKIVFGLGMVLPLIFMYLWLSQFNSKYASFFGAVLYTYAPYRFIDLYVRGDIGENLAFAFIPLTLFFAYKSYKKSSSTSVLLGGVSLALLILSHNAISLMAVPFILFYSGLLIYLSKNRKSLIINHLSLIAIGFLLSAFFWVPALLEGKYTLRNLLTAGTYINRFVNFKELIYGPWNYGQSGQFTVQLGLFQWISLMASPFAIFFLKKDKHKYFLGLGLFIFSMLSIFLMLSVSNFVWSKILLLQNFQFPWRFLALTVFTTSVLGALLLDSLSKKINLKFVTIVSILIIVLVSSFYTKPKAYQYKPESFYSGVYSSTTDTGESSPVWSVRFMEHFPKSHLQVVDGAATINELSRTSTEHSYSISVSKKTLFEENTLYFPGWEILANGKDVRVQFQNKDYQGVMLFFLDKGNYTVDAKYSETKLRAISDAISVVVLFNILGFVGFRFVKRYFS